MKIRHSERCCCASSRRGVAAVEFAVVLPLFLLLLAGMIEFGQAFRIQHALSTASRNGARAASVEGATSLQVIEKVKSHCTRLLAVSAADVTVSISVNGLANADLTKATKGAEIAVTVAIPFSRAGIGFYATMLANPSLTSTCIIERE